MTTPRRGDTVRGVIDRAQPVDVLRRPAVNSIVTQDLSILHETQALRNGLMETLSTQIWRINCPAIILLLVA
jgi:hypothetical protein